MVLFGNRFRINFLQMIPEIVLNWLLKLIEHCIFGRK